MDSSWAFVWRGVLEYARGDAELARVSFRRALALHPDPGVRGLDAISPGAAELYDREFRAIRIFHPHDLDQPARRLGGPALAYPAALRHRHVAGDALLRMIVDTSGRVNEDDVEILAAPDSAFFDALKRMMTAAQFSPARIAGKPVRSVLAYHLTISAPSASDPVKLINLARSQTRTRPDSALALLEDALDPAAGATPAIRVYAQLVQGIAWHRKGDSARAAAAFDAALTQYRELRARGVDFAPFLRTLADSIRMRTS